jgi:hypothetical protein
MERSGNGENAMASAAKNRKLVNRQLSVCRESTIMRISEIIFWNNEPTEQNRSDSRFDLPPGPFGDDLTSLANAFTRRGLVKHLWNPNRSEGQASGPTPPDGGTELIPSGTLEPSPARVQAEPVEEEPPAGLHRLVPFRQYRGISRLT